MMSAMEAFTFDNITMATDCYIANKTLLKEHGCDPKTEYIPFEYDSANTSFGSKFQCEHFYFSDACENV